MSRGQVDALRKAVVQLMSGYGQHHYATDDGRASPKRYSEMMSADRLLRLAGCEVFRFGGYELCQPNAEDVLIQFYRSLFDRFSLLAVPTPNVSQ